MARGKTNNDDLLMEDELAAAFLGDDDDQDQATQTQQTEERAQEEQWEEEVTGQLAVDVYETETRLVVKARTAGVNKQDLDVSISDGVLTINGTLSSGDDAEVVQWHIQECYWGEFSRTLALPVQVKEEEVEAVLKDGVLTIGFTKVKQEQARKIQIQ
jgi:HSP20 family protein